jgi:uncharacterized protein YqgV (UPF0045/DUF77 family)
MYALYVHRDEGLTFMTGPYATAIEAHQARMEYVQAAKRNGFKARRGRVATFLRAKGVKFEVWVERVENAN